MARPHTRPRGVSFGQPRINRNARIRHFDVRYAPDSRAKADIADGPSCARSRLATACLDESAVTPADRLSACPFLTWQSLRCAGWGQIPGDWTAAGPVRAVANVIWPCA